MERAALRAIAGFKSCIQRLAARMRPLLSPTVSHEQRRGFRRARCRFLVWCHAEAGSFQGIVMDMSSTGLRLAVPHRIKSGTVLRLECREPIGRGQARVTGVITRCTRPNRHASFEAGITFSSEPEEIEQSWVPAMMKRLGLQQDGSEQRVHYRVPVQLPCRVERCDLDDGYSHDGRLIDLAPGGALVEAREPLGLGVQLALHLPTGPEGPACSGRVIRLERYGHGRWRMAIRFDRASEELPLLA